MLRIIFALILALLVGLAPAKAATSDIVRNAISGFILAGYERFTGEAELQTKVVANLCQSPDKKNLAAARSQFGALVISWSRVEAIRFGPVLTQNRLERILFWPDRKSTGLKQVQRALANKDKTVIDLDSLRRKSVALQSLGALEFVLYGTGAEELETADGALRCAYAHTISRALATTGAEIAADWLDPNGITKHMLDPRPEWADYRTENEVLQELLGVWVHGAELVRDTRITPFFAETAKASKYKRALFWRSNLTIPSIRANVAGMRDLFIVSGIADALSDTARWAGGAFIFELENFDRTAGEIKLPIDAAITDTEARSKINYLRILTGSLQNLAVDQIAAELGLSVGFSALDGD